jgi:hypothetical protein
MAFSIEVTDEWSGKFEILSPLNTFADAVKLVIVYAFVLPQ